MNGSAAGIVTHGNVGQVDISAHRVENLALTTAEDGSQHVAMDFVWYGLLRDGQAMKARTHHEWDLRDTGERYLRLHRFTVTAVEPFTPVRTDTALAAVSGMVDTD